MKKRFVITLMIVSMLLSLCMMVVPKSVQAAKPGMVYAQGTKFVIDGYPFYFAGCNSYDLFTKSHAEIDKRMSDMAEDGVTVVRTWGFSHEEWHGFEPKKGVYSEEQFRLFDYIIQSAAAHGIKVIITLENYWEAYGGIDARLKWEGLPGVTHANRAKFYTHPGCKEGYINYIKHFVNRTNFYTGVPYKEDPTVFSWELMNEPRYQDAGENSTGITLRKWVDEMAGYIKELDPNHMVAAGIEGHEAKYGFGGDEGNPFIYIQQSPYIDFCTAHPYPDEPWAGLTPAQSATLVNAWIDDAHNVVGKPFVLEEFNTHSNKEDYWNAMYTVMEARDAAGDNFWNYNDKMTSNFDMQHGDSLLIKVFKPHSVKMAAKNINPVHKPLAFNQTLPASGVIGVLPTTLFQWEPAIGAKTYNITVAEDSSFTSPLINATGITDTQYVHTADLKAGTKYYWKVTAVNPLGSTAATNSGASFTTKAAAVVKPGSFTLNAPLADFVGVLPKPTFKWTASNEATSYQLVVSKNSNYTSPVLAVTRLTTTSYTPSTALELGTTYYWKVTAVNNMGTTDAANSGSKFITADLEPVNTTVNVMAMLNAPPSKQETQYKIVVTNTGGAAIDKFSTRIYMDLSEVYAAGYDYTKVLSEKLFDQTSGKTTLSGPLPWDESKKIYYIEVNWNAYSLAGGSAIEQDVRLRLDNWGSYWDATNDFSLTGLTGAFAETQYIPIYRGNLKMYGKDPVKGNVPPTGFKVSGYVLPDLQVSTGGAPMMKEGFSVAISGTELSTKTDEKGYFEIASVPASLTGYTIAISKPGYLLRELKDVTVNADVGISTSTVPILLWAGDIAIDGKQDGAINMADIMEIAKAFNTTAGDTRYIADNDLNKDSAINMADIMIVASHFNAVTGTYPVMK